MKRWVGTIIVTLAVVAGGAFLTWKMTYDQSTVKLHGQTFHMTVLREEDELRKGLSGTDSLPAGEAMLFVFPSDSKWGIWMKDMKYPIDIVWLNANREVVHLVKDAQPSSYPDTTFTPDKDARYVIELASGTIERTGISIGDPAGMPSGI